MYVALCSVSGQHKAFDLFLSTMLFLSTSMVKGAFDITPVHDESNALDACNLGIIRGNTPPQRPDRPGWAGSAAPLYADRSPARHQRH